MIHGLWIEREGKTDRQRDTDRQTNKQGEGREEEEEEKDKKREKKETPSVRGTIFRPRLRGASVGGCQLLAMCT